MPANTLKPGDELDLGHDSGADSDGPVECLGKTYANDVERREYYLGLLAEKLKDPEFRKIEGFPIGEDEDILNLSDPPYYTACPNPFIEEFITQYGRLYDPAEEYKREPYAADVSEGKNDPIYNAHSYHTKVPHKAIMRYILHYTNPGDIVFDGFCGSGMTGVAAQMCGNRMVVQSLGYQIDKEGVVYQESKNADGKSDWTPFSKLGRRHAVISDLSPAASFIAYNYNMPVAASSFDKLASKILQEVEDECGWMYETKHDDGNIGRINYTIWSDVFSCPECAQEIIFWDAAVNQENGETSKTLVCDGCGSENKKLALDRVWLTRLDPITGLSNKLAKQVPVLINYSLSKKSFNKIPDADDFLLLNQLESENIPYQIPVDELPDGFNTRQPKGSHGLSHVHHFYTKRNLWVFAAFVNKSLSSDLRNHLLGVAKDCQSYATKMIKLNVKRLLFGGGQFMGFVGGTLYIPSLHAEQSTLKSIVTKANKVGKNYLNYGERSRNLIGVGSLGQASNIPSDSMDYIFLDPPFGSNLNYSELNFLWESWMKVWTRIKQEAIENQVQGKGPSDYRYLMRICFEEAYRLLKPGRWMTVEFSNTQASVWGSIQTALAESGFVVANVSALDKKQGTFKAYTTPTAVKQDLIISVYKPNGEFEERFSNETDEDGLWDFVRTHLGYLPVVKKQLGEMGKIQERDPRILFDQVISYFIRNLRSVPVSSKEFQEGLLERFAERDGMIFLSEQVAEYDKARISSKQLRQLSIFVDDEASAIEWLRQLLNEKPQSYQDIHPKFINELGGWKKAEEQLELSTLLEQNLIKYDGFGPLPPQIHSYLSTNFKEFRNLKKDDSQLIKKAKDRWYVPNPEREEDLQKLRERSLLSEFAEYKNYTGKKLKKVRLEAVRYGFKKAWKERDYPTIISVAEKIPQDLLQEDQNLLMWYDQAQTRQSDENLF